MKKAWFFLTLVLVAAVALAACQGQTAEETAAPPPAASTATAIPPTATPVPPTATPVPTVQPPEPQRITFEGEHGTMVGYYYPAAEVNAPVVVLMHWAPGDQTDWCAIAPWLQNRADENPTSSERCAAALEAGNHPWLDASWFPPMPTDGSVAVFTFDFPGFGESQSSTWVDVTAAYHGGSAQGNFTISRGDLQAVADTVANLPGIDPQRVAMMGASIGADAAETTCFLYNETYEGGCLGAFSFSPGDYLGESYLENVILMGQKYPETVQWCAYAFERSCKDASELVNQYITFPDGHAMEYFARDFFPMHPPRDATIMDFILEFLEAIGFLSLG